MRSALHAAPLAALPDWQPCSDVLYYAMDTADLVPLHVRMAVEEGERGGGGEGAEEGAEEGGALGRAEPEGRRWGGKKERHRLRREGNRGEEGAHWL